MSETFKKYKEYISSETYKQKFNELKSAESKGGPSAQSFKETTQIKMLWLNRQPFFNKSDSNSRRNPGANPKYF